MTRTRFLAASMCVGLCIPLTVSAATTAELQTLLAQLQAQLAALQQQAGSQTTSSAPPAPPVPITRTLSRGMRGEDVRAVQQFLISQGLLAADSATGFFGPLTENAVKQWQSSHGIVSQGTPATTGYGSVGPRTRAAMAQVVPGMQGQGFVQPAFYAPSQNVTPSNPTTSQSCTPDPTSPQTQTFSCSSGQAGVITQTRISTCAAGATSPVWTTVTANTCAMANTSNTWQTGSWSICANSAQSRAVSCVSSNAATVSDSYCAGIKPAATQSCTITTSSSNQACTFNNQTVAHGTSVTAYQSGSVPSGSQCLSEQRTCMNGSLSGTYMNASCARQTAAAGATMQVKVLQFNIKNPWGYTTTHAEYETAVNQVVTAIRDTQADIVGDEEVVPDVFARITAQLTGWSSLQTYADAAVFTRYQIVGHAGKYGAQIRLPTGGDAYIFVMHNMDSPYQPYDIRDGNLTCDQVNVEQAARAARMSITSAYLADMAPYLATGAPVFLVGDMNEPSHEDWTAAAAAAGLHRCAVIWPTSKAIVDAGFVDTYRVTHPNEVASPGITWTTQPASNEVLDRIDFVYADPASKVTASYTIGDGVRIPAEIVSGNYWSDHAGVMSTLTIKADYTPVSQ